MHRCNDSNPSEVMQGPANPDKLRMSSLHIRQTRGGLKLEASQEAVWKPWVGVSTTFAGIEATPSTPTPPNTDGENSRVGPSTGFVGSVNGRPRLS